MGFSYSKAASLKPKKEKYLLTFILAIITSAAFFVPYMIDGEGYFTFYGDFNVQQIPFYQFCHQAIKEGNIAWNWNTDLGANFIGSYSFYLLGSPFFWLTIPFSNSFVPYLMGPLLILKFGCAAVTAYMYIRRFTRTPEAASLGGLMYAFSGFTIYNIFFNHFHEAIIVFPLLLLSIELLLTENRRFIFALAVCLCAVTNYFFFFGMVVFSVIYFIVRLFSKAIKVKFTSFLIFVFEAVLGLALSAFLLVPSIMAITGNNRITEFLNGWNAIMYGKEQIYANVLQCFFFPPDIPARPIFFPGAEVKWSSLGGWLPIFSMVGVFTWFKYKTNHWLKRVLGICIFMSMVPILNSAFYAFNTSYYARWFYMPILLMCLATVILTEDTETNWSYGYKWVLGITLAVTAVIGFFPDENDDGTYTYGLHTQDTDNELTYTGRFWIACAIAIAGLLILGILIKILKTNRKAFFTTATVCVCIISIIYGNVYIASGRSHSYEIKEVMIDQLIEGNVYLEDGNDDYRVDVYDGVDNTSMYLGFQGINAFHSVVPASVFEFYDYIGIERSVGSRPETDYYAIRPLLSVKYLLNPKCGDSFLDDDDNPLMYGFNYLKTENDYYIYENDNHVPYGFSYDYYMSYEFCDEYSDENRAAMMLKAMLLTDKQIEKYSGILQNIEDIEYYDYSYETSVDINDETYEFDCNKLAQTSAKSFETNKKGFKAVVERDRQNLVFFSVPYDEGWTATVNGKKAEIEKVNAGFMAVVVPKGISTIEFTYTTPGLSSGIAISVFALFILLVYIMIFKFFIKKKNSEIIYPEGEELLLKWRMDEISEDKKNIEINIPDDSDNRSEKATDNTPNQKEKYEGGFKINTDFM